MSMASAGMSIVESDVRPTLVAAEHRDALRVEQRRAGRERF
jgi:hypothetical protein